MGNVCLRTCLAVFLSGQCSQAKPSADPKACDTRDDWDPYQSKCTYHPLASEPGVYSTLWEPVLLPSRTTYKVVREEGVCYRRIPDMDETNPDKHKVSPRVILHKGVIIQATKMLENWVQVANGNCLWWLPIAMPIEDEEGTTLVLQKLKSGPADRTQYGSCILKEGQL